MTVHLELGYPCLLEHVVIRIRATHIRFLSFCIGFFGKRGRHSTKTTETMGVKFEFLSIKNEPGENKPR